MDMARTANPTLFFESLINKKSILKLLSIYSSISLVNTGIEEKFRCYF